MLTAASVLALLASVSMTHASQSEQWWTLRKRI